MRQSAEEPAAIESFDISHIQNGYRGPWWFGKKGADEIGLSQSSSFAERKGAAKRDQWKGSVGDDGLCEPARSRGPRYRGLQEEKKEISGDLIDGGSDRFTLRAGAGIVADH